ncbi:MAG TPA: hypothetical protein VHN58_07595 [Croceicoccus sp.]|nr:hypothetical protein [Croceicoccus sp.]
MSFQPLGYRFEVRSHLSREAAKAAIRSRKNGWFERKDSPRGWIVGPFACLWLSAFDSQGPMIVAYILRHSLGSRLVGRAGADLNGVAYLILCVLVLVFSLYQLREQGPISIEFWAWVGLAIAAFLFVLVMAHRQRRDAEPLIEFLQSAMAMK